MMPLPVFRQARNTAFALLLFTGTGSTASFSCAGVTTPDEKAICADRSLGEKDVRMATTYTMLREVVLMGGRGALQDEQNAWLQKRQQCGGNTICLSHFYDDRIDVLNSQYRKLVASLNR